MGSRTSTCDVCSSSVPSSSDAEPILIESCGHTVCSSCFSAHLDKHILRSRRSFVNLPCPLPICGSILEDTQRRQSLIREHGSESLVSFVDSIISETCPTITDLSTLPTLSDFGYDLHDGIVTRVASNDPLDSSYYFVNENHFIAVASAVTRMIRSELLSLGLIERHFHQDEEEEGETESSVDLDLEGGLFCENPSIYMTDPSSSASSTLLVLCPGYGKVRAGQWSRRLLLSSKGGVRVASVLSWVERALEENFDVMVLNPNLRSVPPVSLRHDPDFIQASTNWLQSSSSKPSANMNANFVPLSQSDSHEHHVQLIWDQFILPRLNSGSITQVLIVAHSYGAKSTLELFRCRPSSLSNVIAAAFLDGVTHKANEDDCDEVKELVGERCRQWAIGGKAEVGTVYQEADRERGVALLVSAGTGDHDRVPAASMEDVFRYFGERLEVGV